MIIIMLGSRIHVLHNLQRGPLRIYAFMPSVLVALALGLYTRLGTVPQPQTYLASIFREVYAWRIVALDLPRSVKYNEHGSNDLAEAMQTFSEARELLTDMYACYRLQSTRTHISLLPKYMGNIKAGITEQLNAQVGLYSQKLGGVMIAYNNVRLLNSHGNILDDQPYLHFNVQTDYIIFQPTVGSILKGCVNHISKGHIGCLVHSCFNAAIPQPWDSGNAWPGYSLVIEQEFLFEVDQIHSQNGILSMRGKLIDSSLLQSTPAKGIKRKLQSECTTPCSKRHCSSSSQSTETSRDAIENDECSDIMAAPSTKKKKKKKHKKDTDLSSDSGIEFLPSPGVLVKASHSKHRKHNKRKVSTNSDGIPVAKDECFEDNEDSFASTAHDHLSVDIGLDPSSHQSTPRQTSTQTLESASTTKKHKKSKKIKTEPQ